MKRSFVVFLLFLSTRQTQANIHVKIDSIVIAQQSQIIEPGKVIRSVRDTIFLVNARSSVLIYLSPYTRSTVFKYRLSRIFNQTLETGNNYLNFNNLPVGEYLLEVWQSTARFKNKRQLLIIVEAPIWLKWWFLPVVCFYVLVIFAIGFYFLYRYRVRQLLRLHAVRDSIARDLHDEVGSYLSSISVMTQAVVNLSDRDPARAKTLTFHIGDTARQVADSMGEIIWSVNPGNDSLEKLTIHMRDVAAEVLGEQQTDFSFEAGEDLLDQYLPLSKRRDFLLIYKEALTNIMKYAKADSVRIVVSGQGELLKLQISDNGVGFDINSLPKQTAFGGNGLANMKVRAERIGAILQIQSEVHEGTHITLLISKN